MQTKDGDNSITTPTYKLSLDGILFYEEGGYANQEKKKMELDKLSLEKQNQIDLNTILKEMDCNRTTCSRRLLFN